MNQLFEGAKLKKLKSLTKILTQEFQGSWGGLAKTRKGIKLEFVEEQQVEG